MTNIFTILNKIDTDTVKHTNNKKIFRIKNSGNTTQEQDLIIELLEEIKDSNGEASFFFKESDANRKCLLAIFELDNVYILLDQLALNFARTPRQLEINNIIEYIEENNISLNVKCNYSQIIQEELYNNSTLDIFQSLQFTDRQDYDKTNFLEALR